MMADSKEWITLDDEIACVEMVIDFMADMDATEECETMRAVIEDACAHSSVSAREAGASIILPCRRRAGR